MGNLSLPTPVEGRTAAAAGKEDVLLVAGFGSPAAADYAAHAGRRSLTVDLSDPSAPANLEATIGGGRVTALILFLKPRLTEAHRRALDEILTIAGQQQAEFLGIVSTFRVHLGDRAAEEAEAHVLSRAKGLGARTVVFRPAQVLRNDGSLWLGSLYPLVPGRLRGCCIDEDELFAAIDDARRKPGPPGTQVYTLLGPNRPWREVLARRRARGPVSFCLTAVCALLAFTLVGHLAALVLDFLARRRPALRRWNVPTLRPDSFEELLALYNRYNYRHVKVVGYNNGVIHFGQRYPGRTVVSTVHCNHVALAGPGLLEADCGATVRKALDFLAASGRELPVVPNYSYVCLGTAFFVPVHGSASDFSTVADTITRVALYDPVEDRTLTVTRDEPAFREHVYNMRADVLLLQLQLRVKPKSRYYVHREALQNPGSAELLEALRDGRAANVEIRKSRAGSDTVTVSRYYSDPGAAQFPVLELPRDALGRLWDRLEENALTSVLMHALTRYFAWHVELFFTAEEFAVFWDSHRSLPLRKLQLRHIRRDGLPHSPFREHDCVSVDLFMLRRHRLRFESYLKETFRVVRTNPGKHSR